MFQTTANFIRPDSSISIDSSNLPIKKKSFFSNFKIDLLLSSKNKSVNQNNTKLLKSQSILNKNVVTSSSSPFKQRQIINVKNQNSISSKDSYKFFENIRQDKDGKPEILKSRLSSPFFLRKSYSEAYKYNPFITSNNGSHDLDQISRISSSTSSTTIRTDSGLSSVDSTQLLCAELKDCLEKGESYSNIEIKFRKNLYAFWCLDEYGNSIFHLVAKYGSLDALRSVYLLCNCFTFISKF